MPERQSDPKRLPNETPRPPGELEELERVWAYPPGWRKISEINNSLVGVIYIGAAFLFFLLAGVLALIMRVQLSHGDNRFIGQDLYNQIFTVHGTTMMFLFAVPVMEALSVILLPQMLAARDLPFPRLSAFAVWAYVIGGLVFFSTIFYGLSPSGGWFMYPPLTLTKFSPGDNADFWLLGIGFIEISAIAGAIEIIVGMLRTRPPGMTLDKMPLFGWSMLVFAAMIVFAFPAVILATMMLEIERSFGWPFFTAAQSGDPLLWQHLFWFFGHPGSLHHLPAGGRSRLDDRADDGATAADWLPADRRRADRDRLLQLRPVGASHVQHRHSGAEPRFLFGREHGGRRAFRHSGLLMDRDHRFGARSIQNSPRRRCSFSDFFSSSRSAV